LLTTSGVVEFEPANTVSPPYVPVIVSVPTGAADELQDALPPDSGAVQSDIDPIENVTDPVGVGTPVALVVTVAEYVTDVPRVAGLGVATTAVCDGALLTTSGVVPVEPTNTVSPE
jgi:hypothetical protein